MSRAQQPMPPARPGQSEQCANQGTDLFNRDHVANNIDIPSFEKICAAGNVNLSNFLGPLTPTDQLNSMSFPNLDFMQGADFSGGFGLGIENSGLMPNIGNGTIIMTTPPMTAFPGGNPMGTMPKQDLRTPSKKHSPSCQLITPDPTPVCKRHIDMSQGKANAVPFPNLNVYESSLGSLSQESGRVPINAQAPLSPTPATGCLLPSNNLDMAVMPDPNCFAGSPLFDVGFSVGNSTAPSPEPSPHFKLSPADSSVNLSPELFQQPVFDNPVGMGTASATAMEGANSPFAQNGLVNGDVHIQDEPEDESDVGSLDVAACIDPTGVTSDQVAAYISGPDTSNGQWACTFPGCNWKPFDRKENVKCHVQTHLDDRKYKCPGCTKRFVREHDLKRHWKIHTGKKPHRCDCGKSFARHDAWTRHRARGTCEGAFESAKINKKKGQRGRPRKNPQGAGDRKEKKRQVRKNAKNAQNAIPMSATSSSSGTSLSSYPQSASPVDEGSENASLVPFGLLGQGIDEDLLIMTQGALGVTAPQEARGATTPPLRFPSSETAMTPDEGYCLSASASPVESIMDDVMSNVGGNAMLLPSADASPLLASALKPIGMVKEASRSSSPLARQTKSKEGQVDLTDPRVVLEMYADFSREPPVIETTNILLLQTIELAKEYRERFMPKEMSKTVEAGNLSSS